MRDTVAFALILSYGGRVDPEQAGQLKLIGHVHRAARACGHAVSLKLRDRRIHVARAVRAFELVKAGPFERAPSGHDAPTIR